MLEILRRIVQEVNGARSLDAALSIIVRRIRKAMQTDVCSVYLRDDERDCFILMDTIGLNASAIGQVTLKPGEGLVGLVGQREEPLNIEEAPSHSHFRYFAETGEERYSSFLGVPIIHQRRVLGVLVVQQREKRQFGEGEEAFLITMAAQLAGVLVHALSTGALARLSDPSTQALLNGIAAAPGMAIGEAFVVVPSANLEAVPERVPEDIDAEITRLREAIDCVRHDIRQAAERLASRISAQEQALFDVYQQMLGDAALGNEVEKRIRDGQWAPYALSRVVQRHVNYLERVDDNYLRERAADIRDLGRRVLAHLQKDSSARQPVYPDHTILVGDEISAAQLGEIPREKLAGLVALRGSSTSHVAILARAMGIPAVMGMNDLPISRLAGTPMIVDGYRGRLILRPQPDLMVRYESMIEEEKALTSMLESEQSLPSETSDGFRIRLMINTGLAVEMSGSPAARIDGVGLYRTEVPFMMHQRFPSEKEQTRIYREQLQGFAPLPVVMRTLDIGGDKSLPYFPIEEENPFLGWRGIRVTLDHPEVLMVQLRAMLKAAEGLDNLRILLPMVTSVEEVDTVCRLLDRAILELRDDGVRVERPLLGVMLEVPAVIYQLEALASRVDFFSVGSNDLIQYLLAVDRNNARVSGLYDACQPAVLRALDQIARESRRLNVSASVCGELAGDPIGALLLIGMGYRVLSMNAPNLSRVRAAIRRVSLEGAQNLVSDVLALHSLTETRELVYQRMQEWELAHLLPPRD
ncbi:phosphoenolpyruvate--protein phosphotransferase [Kushneria indalinina]|uniref:phosphoenolpyruvate--protein phosphotransferase n=1 Tax=Kushneria indalinina DSM 14324 TaxID=1122140 RepID=A0A3D9DUK7_9GAMM|nr:phosphoenolpyruvate--protein phosphotransferase [Kushneria indalinina]REC94335.1 PTSINtr with GAF domain PtsP [Kushneria indalinina DSM 14324]